MPHLLPKRHYTSIRNFEFKAIILTCRIHSIVSHLVNVCAPDLLLNPSQHVLLQHWPPSISAAYRLYCDVEVHQLQTGLFFVAAAPSSVLVLFLDGHWRLSCRLSSVSHGSPSSWLLSRSSTAAWRSSSISFCCLQSKQQRCYD